MKKNFIETAQLPQSLATSENPPRPVVCEFCGILTGINATQIFKMLRYYQAEEQRQIIIAEKNVIGTEMQIALKLLHKNNPDRIPNLYNIRFLRKDDIRKEVGPVHLVFTLGDTSYVDSANVILAEDFRETSLTLLDTPEPKAPSA